MKIKDIFLNYINRERKLRQVGRYWASDIYSIVKGYLTPENFLEPTETNLSGCRMIITGEASEEKLKMIFDQVGVECEYQVKKEYQLTNEITLVVRPDFVFQNFIIETKFPFSLIKNDEIPLRYTYQLEAYYRAFDYKKVYLGILSTPFNLKLIEYPPSKWRWKQICRILEKFHQELKKLKVEQKQIKLK